MLCKMRSHDNTATERGKPAGNKGKKKKVELTTVIMYDLFVYCAKSWIVIVSSRFKRENKLF